VNEKFNDFKLCYSRQRLAVGRPFSDIVDWISCSSLYAILGVPNEKKNKEVEGLTKVC